MIKEIPSGNIKILFLKGELLERGWSLKISTSVGGLPAVQRGRAAKKSPDPGSHGYPNVNDILAPSTSGDNQNIFTR